MEAHLPDSASPRIASGGAPGPFYGLRRGGQRTRRAVGEGRNCDLTGICQGRRASAAVDFRPSHPLFGSAATLFHNLHDSSEIIELFAVGFGQGRPRPQKRTGGLGRGPRGPTCMITGWWAGGAIRFGSYSQRSDKVWGISGGGAGAIKSRPPTSLPSHLRGPSAAADPVGWQPGRRQVHVHPQASQACCDSFGDAGSPVSRA